NPVVGRILEDIKHGHSRVRELVDSQRLKLTLEEVEVYHEKRQSLRNGTGGVGVQLFYTEPQQGMNNQGGQVLDEEHHAPRDLRAKVLDIKSDLLALNAIGDKGFGDVQGNLLVCRGIQLSES